MIMRLHVSGIPDHDLHHPDMTRITREDRVGTAAGPDGGPLGAAPTLGLATKAHI